MTSIPPSPSANLREAIRPAGIWGAVLLPLDKSGEIDWSALAEEVEFLRQSDLAGIYTNGSAGEFHTQTEAEFDKITGIVSNIARKFGKPFQIGVSNTNPRVARDRLHRVRDIGLTAVQITLPDWWPPSADEIFRFADGMQEASRDTPLIIYNPPHAKIRLSLRQIAGGDAEWYNERRRLLDGYSVFVPGHMVAFGRPLGADGSYSNVACLSPNGAVKLWNLIDTDPSAASEIEAWILQFLSNFLLPLKETHDLSDQALDKLMAAAGGWGPVAPDLLWPYSFATAEHVKLTGRAARRDLPELF